MKPTLDDLLHNSLIATDIPSEELNERILNQSTQKEVVPMRKKETKNHRDIMRMGPRTEMSMAVMYMVFLMKNWCQKELFLLY